MNLHSMKRSLKRNAYVPIIVALLILLCLITLLLTASRGDSKTEGIIFRPVNVATTSPPISSTTTSPPPTTTTSVVNTRVPLQTTTTVVSESGGGDVWFYLRQCESHGNYQINTGNGYYGAYQFSAPTWNSMNTGYEFAHLAPPEVQDDAAIRLQQRSGWGQWPVCSKVALNKAG